MEESESEPESESREVALALRREAVAVLRASADITAKAATTTVEEDGPAAQPKRRIRATLVAARPADGDITGAADAPEKDLMMSAAMRRALGTAPEAFVTPKKRPRDDARPPWTPGIAPLAVAFSAWGRCRLGATLKLLCALLDGLHAEAACATNTHLTTGAAALDFAAAATALLRRELAAVGGVEAVRGAARRVARVESPLAKAAHRELGALASSLAERPIAARLVAPSRDWAVPSDESRHDSDPRVFNGRERARDAFLQLLRDFQAAQSAVDGRALASLLRKEDPPPSNKNRRGPHAREPATLRRRASGLVRSLAPESVGWFARLFDATLVRVALSPDGDRIRALEARLSNREAPRSRPDQPADSFGHDELFFYLFAAGADAALFQTHVLAALSRGIAADIDAATKLPPEEILDRVGVRARLAGALACAPAYADDIQVLTWPPGLDPAPRLAAPFAETHAYAASMSCATHLCRALEWVRAPNTLPEAAAAAFASLAKRPPSPVAAFARLELERLFDDLDLAAPEISVRLDDDRDLLLTEDERPDPPSERKHRLDDDDDSGVDVAALLRRSKYGAQIRAAFATSTPAAPPTPQLTTKKKLRPFLVAAEDDDGGDDAAEALFAPLAARFFARYPLIHRGVELAIDAAAARVQHDRDATPDDDDALEVARERLKVLDFLAPPDAPERLTSIARNLALAHFEEKVLPALRRPQRTKDHVAAALEARCLLETTTATTIGFQQPAQQEEIERRRRASPSSSRRADPARVALVFGPPSPSVLVVTPRGKGKGKGNRVDAVEHRGPQKIKK